MPANIFEPTANGYAGRVRLFGIDEAIVLVAIEPGDGENTPAYRIHLDDEDGPEIGGAWKRVGERAGDYIALEIDSPLVFDVVDLANRVSLGGATYHVTHPGGRSYEHPPVNAKEADARRARRFEAMGHTTGAIDVEALAESGARRAGEADDYPLILDLRRRTPRRWGRG